MWTTSIEEKRFEGATLKVHVKFDNGTRSFGETFTVQNVDELDIRIASHVASLSALDTFAETLTVGAYKHKEKPAPAEPTELQLAEQKLYECKRLIELGVMNETDKEYEDAIIEYKLVR